MDLQPIARADHHHLAGHLDQVQVPLGQTDPTRLVHLQVLGKAEQAGVDAIIGVAAGAGGHAGRISPYALIPYLKQHLSVPVIAAGCISTGRQILASMALGAELAYMGTRFIVSEECGAEDAYKRAVVDAGPEDIVYTDEVSGVHANFIGHTLPSKQGDQSLQNEPKRRRDIWSAGHGVAEIEDVQTIEEIVESLVREYHDALAALGA